MTDLGYSITAGSKIACQATALTTDNRNSNMPAKPKILLSLKPWDRIELSKANVRFLTTANSIKVSKQLWQWPTPGNDITSALELVAISGSPTDVVAITCCHFSRELVVVKNAEFVWNFPAICLNSVDKYFRFWRPYHYFRLSVVVALYLAVVQNPCRFAVRISTICIMLLNI